MSDHYTYDIWLETEPKIPELPWRAQMHTYVAQFKTQEDAQKYVEQKRAAELRQRTIDNGLPANFLGFRNPQQD